MVTVSKLANSYNNQNVASFQASQHTQKTVEQNFQAKKKGQNATKSTLPKEDSLVENTFSNRLKIGIEKTTNIPLVHFPRGLGGAPDFTFFEFLQTAKFPYYVGGPILAALFYAGVKKDNFQSAKAAKNVAKHMALGVGLYYAGAALAKSIVNHTVKWSRGIDLTQPYRKYISTSTNHTGVFKKDVEYHEATESADFTRWDLFYKKGKNADEINATYKRFGHNYGIKDDTNDVDSSVKPLIKKTIIMSRAWKYALTAFYVTLGIGMANQKAWENESGLGFKQTIKTGIFGKHTKFSHRIQNAKIAVYDYMLKPFGQSFKEFWKGHSKASSIAGKSVIVSTALATALAISMLIGKTSASNHKIHKKDNSSGEVA